MPTDPPVPIPTPDPTTVGPTNSPSPRPSTAAPATTEPTTAPSPRPSTAVPITTEPTPFPASNPTANPTTQEPTSSPTVSPTPGLSTQEPTQSPTNGPTARPTPYPTTHEPTNTPSTSPVTTDPTTAPTATPTNVPVTTSPTPSLELFRTSNAMTTQQVFFSLGNFTQHLEDDVWVYLDDDGTVSSESQGAAMLTCAIVLASWDRQTLSGTTEEERQDVEAAFGAYFNGWKRMCKQSTASCGESFVQCRDYSDLQYSVCIPDARMDSTLGITLTNGTNPKGDTDAITAMVLATRAVWAVYDGSPPSWYNEVRRWADSAQVFFLDKTVTSIESTFLLTGGACSTDWAEIKPSIYSPGQFKVIRDYGEDFPVLERGSLGYQSLGYLWDPVIENSNDILALSQCSAQGMVPSYMFLTTESDGEIKIDFTEALSADASQREFGPDASTTIWQAAFDVAIGIDSIVESTAFVWPVISALADSMEGVPSMPWAEFGLTTCSIISMEHPVVKQSAGWTSDASMYGPILSSLVVPSPVTTTTFQQQMIDAAGVILATTNSSYSSSSLTAALLANLMLGGAAEDSASVLDFVPPYLA